MDAIVYMTYRVFRCSYALEEYMCNESHLVHICGEHVIGECIE